METLQRELLEAAMNKGCSFDYHASVPVLVIYRIDLLDDSYHLISRIYLDDQNAKEQIINLLAILNK